MSGTGCFYEVADHARHSLTGLGSKSEWYKALGQCDLDSNPRLNPEQSLQYAWISILREQPPPLGLIFVGDLRTEPDQTGDPEVVFLGAPLVKSIAASLATTDESFFLQIFAAGGIDRGHIWLLEPMRAFFQSAASRDNAVIVLWGD